MLSHCHAVIGYVQITGCVPCAAVVDCCSLEWMGSVDAGGHTAISESRGACRRWIFLRVQRPLQVAGS
jgi:hypothetical protein